jgi:probable rRNA maturation factor
VKVAVVNRTGAAAPVARIRRQARAILALLGERRATLSVALVGDREIRALNARYRNQDRPTDVLSFVAEAELPCGERLLGDVVISLERAARQAKARRRALERELETLLVHGVLHLLGYDHERSAEDERIMRAMERKLERALGAARK